MTTSFSRVHIVDTVKGPLIGAGRLQRIIPFAVTASLGMAIALPATTWVRPGLAVIGAILIGVAIIAGLVFPWTRVPRVAQLGPAFLFLVSTLLLASANGNAIGSPFVTMLILPLMWLAIYESRTSVLLAATVAGAALWRLVPSGAQTSDQRALSTVVFVVCAAGMGVTLHQLVSDARRMAQVLRDHQHALEDSAAMLDALPERVNRYRLSDHAITYCNAAWAAQYNVAPHRAIGQTVDQFLSDDELAGLNSQLALLGPEKTILVDSVARAVPGGPGQWLEWADRYLVGVDGPEVLSIGRDVTERHDAELKLAESEARFRDLADNSADVVWRFTTKPTPHFEYISPSVEKILGYPASYLAEDFRRVLDLVDDAGRAAIVGAMRGEQMLDHYDFHLRHANGSIIIVETRTTSVNGGLQGLSRDVTELRRLQAKLADLALRDPLTGLANRRLFEELLDADLARTERSGLPLAVAFLDLDGFKNVNDTYGHDVGDLVLRETAERLLSVVRTSDTVARIGGDEFVIVYEPDDESSYNVVSRIDRALSAPIYITATTVVHCSASIGISDTRNVGCNGPMLLAAADDEMYEMKRARRALLNGPDKPQRVRVDL